MATRAAGGNSLSPSHTESPEVASMQEKAHKGSSSFGSKHKYREHARDRERESRNRDRERERGRDKDRDKDRERERNRERDRERDKDMDKYRERERDKDRDRHHRDHHRDRSERRERTRYRDDYVDYYRNRDYDRRKDYDKDREERHRHGSRSHSRAKSEHRSRLRSRSHSKSKRMSGFDMASPAALLPNTAVAVAGQFPGAAPTIQGVFPYMMPLPGRQFGARPVMPVQTMTQQATRHARRVYVGGLPPTANEQSVATLFSHVMSEIGGNTAGPGDAVVNVYIHPEKKFAFVEMRSVEEASNAMALNGIIIEGAPVKVKRPSDYNPSLAATLGPSQPNPNLNLAAVGLTPGFAGGLGGPQRLMLAPNIEPVTKVVCLTNVVTTDELMNDDDYEDILEDMRTECGKFGTLVNLIIPRPVPDVENAPGVGKVYLEYADTESAGKARQGLNGRKFGGNEVFAVFYPEDKFSERDYSG